MSDSGAGRPSPAADDSPREPQDGLALCLSGGGYRAMLFHLGALHRLNELGLLAELDRISSVSGGSITAGVLALHWHQLDFIDGVARRFDELVAQPLLRLAGRTLDLGAIAGGVLLPGNVADWVVSAYRKRLFDDATLQELPDHPRFIFCATSVQTGSLWRFSKPYMGDWQVGLVDHPTTPLAVAVAASSAFPPVLSPLHLELEPGLVQPVAGATLHEEPYTTDVILADGGVYDNLGLEPAWKRYRTILVSDGGGCMAPQPEPRGDWLLHGARVFELIDRQVRSLRKRQVIDSYTAGERTGTYWGIRTHLADYHLPDPMNVDPAVAESLALVATRLARLEPAVQQRLANWGYAVCDAAIRRHFNPGGQYTRPAGWPYPNHPPHA